MAKRINLREFQEGVVARLQNAAGMDAAKISSKLGVRVGRQDWLVDLVDASEVLPVPSMAPVPLTRPWFIGVANVRGVLYSVADLSLFLGGEPTQVNVDSRLLLVNPRYGVNAALVVNRMLGLRNPEQLQRTSDGGSEPWIGGEFTDGDGRIWKELSMAGLVQDQDFLNIAL
jgi:twitching motility protein PilI